MENLFPLTIVLALLLSTGEPDATDPSGDRNGENISAAHANSNITPGISLSGMGWFTNRTLTRTLELLLATGEPDDPIRRNHLEDAALILKGELANRGYLNPTFHFRLIPDEGEPWEGEWRNDAFSPTPPGYRVDFRRLEVRIEHGTLYYFEDLEISGVGDILDTDLTNYFYTSGFLFNTESNRFFSEARTSNGVRSILTELNRAGYPDARLASPPAPDINHETGAVTLELTFEPGLYHRVIKIDVISKKPDESPVIVTRTFDDMPFSTWWLQDYLQRMRRPFFPEGFPDVRTRVISREIIPHDDRVDVSLVVELDPGPRVTTGEISFEGIGHTRERFLRRLIDLEDGENFNIIAAEQGRQRIAGLGIFEFVEVYYPERTEGQKQSVVYRVSPRPSYDVSLLAGYGSYEMIRGGIEFVHRNILGRAMQGRLKLVQSLKSSRAEYLYTIPEVWGDSGGIFLRANYLDREEVTFRRQEIGGAIGTTYFIRPLGINSALQYSFETLSTRSQRFEDAPGVTSANVGALQLTLARDRLDNPLYPTRGTKLFTSYEFADRILGGNVDFQRVELGASAHHPFGGGLVFHGGIRHGVAWSQGNIRDNLPVNRRFFPGGENSIRGYTEGRASPRGPGGGEIGAEVYLLTNLELEQAILPDFSVVVFTDAIAVGESYQSYPGNEWLFSVGLGLRYRTLIGPIRLEYGYNLNPREFDPAGALHLSIGFPF